MTVEYDRVQKASPDYLSKYKGMDQAVDIALSTFVMQADPEPLLDIYDFIMTTFVPSQQGQPPSSEETGQQAQPTQAPQTATEQQKIHVRVELASFKGMWLYYKAPNTGLFFSSLSSTSKRASPVSDVGLVNCFAISHSFRQSYASYDKFG